MKRTYQPKKRQRIRMSGFRARSKYAPEVLKRRRLKGRWRLTVTAKQF